MTSLELKLGADPAKENEGLDKPKKKKTPKITKSGKPSVWRRSPSLLVGAIMVVFIFFVAAFPTLFAENAEKPMTALMDFTAMLKPPTAEHWFGTDNYGRDIYTMVIGATRLDLLIGLGSVALPFVVGSFLGLICGYYGGKLDSIIMRILDVFVAFPFMVLAIAIVAIIGNGIMNLLIAMWIVSWPPYTRLVRSEVLVAKNSEYVQAAKTLGYSDITIIFRHILPNVISSSVVYAASDVVMCIMTAASMSFLGLGVDAATLEWGSIISSGKTYIMGGYWWISTMPGLIMIFVGLGFSLFGDGLNDLLRTKD
ncbi:MAG: ABC transporter permease [Coriobacteriales bacterium]|nr:ABC transporter permease [Coriobacteriales bacterium]